MINITGSTLFIVGSPFQCLCMLEAIDYFQIQDYVVLVGYSDTRSLDKIHTLLSEFNIKYEKRKLSHIVKDYIPMFFFKHRKFDSVFIGDYYNVLNDEVGRLYAKKKYNLYYLDDGTQALSIFSDNPRKRYKTVKEKLVFGLYHYCMSWKRCSTTNFFTIYNVHSDCINIIHNSFTILRQRQSQTKHGIYIIGANSSALKFLDISYLGYLDKVLEYVKSEWANEKITYCPHRRDSNNNLNRDWCQANNIEYFEPSVSVEYDFATKGLSPNVIIGFTSNALYSLKSIYNMAEVYTVYYNLCDVVADKETEIIRNQMIKSGINNLKL